MSVLAALAGIVPLLVAVLEAINNHLTKVRAEEEGKTDALVQRDVTELSAGLARVRGVQRQ